MKLQPRYIFMALLCTLAMLQAAISMPLSLSLPGGHQPLNTLIEKLDATDVDTQKLLPRYRPDSFLIIKKIKDEFLSEQQEPKQIPIISDIERIKKVIEIIEFIGGKVEAVIESLPQPQGYKDIVEVRLPKNVYDNENSEANETTTTSADME